MGFPFPWRYGPFPFTTHRLPDCPHSYQKGLFSAHYPDCLRNTRYERLTLSFLSYQALSPILDIASRANKHLKKAKQMVEYWRGSHGGAFPVKITVPIAMTVFATIQFRNFRDMAVSSSLFSADGNGKNSSKGKDSKLDHDTTPSLMRYFEIPGDYVRKTLTQALREAEAEERRQLEKEAVARRAARVEEMKQKELKNAKK